MRMWMVDPRIMCRKHLLTEHLEVHMFASSLERGKTLTGFLKNNLLEPGSIVRRHDQLAKEMFVRGYKHNTPILFDSRWVEYLEDGKNNKIDVDISLSDLVQRCEICKLNFDKLQIGGCYCLSVE